MIGLGGGGSYYPRPLVFPRMSLFKGQCGLCLSVIDSGYVEIVVIVDNMYHFHFEMFSLQEIDIQIRCKI